jgi:three-Cys-motif partner protein
MTETHRFGGPWTVEKLEAVRAYLSAYAQALKNQPFERNYIDAFAGTGDRAAKRQEAQTVLEIPELDAMTKGARPMARRWVENIRAVCQDQNVAFFFKQWGGTHKGRQGRLLNGRTWMNIR